MDIQAFGNTLSLIYQPLIEKAITNQNAKEYLNQNVFGDVRIALKQLLDYIQESGELERYWSIMEKQNDEARKAARKIEKERKRLEMGSDYESSGNEGGFGDEYYSGESDVSEEEDDEISHFDDNLESSRAQSIQVKQKLESRKVSEAQVEMPFNALRYLGEALKSVASDRKVNQNKKK